MMDSEELTKILAKIDEDIKDKEDKIRIRFEQIKMSDPTLCHLFGKIEALRDIKLILQENQINVK